MLLMFVAVVAHVDAVAPDVAYVAVPEAADIFVDPLNLLYPLNFQEI